MGILADKMRRMLQDIKRIDEQLILEAEHLLEQARAIHDEIDEWLQDEDVE